MGEIYTGAHSTKMPKNDRRSPRMAHKTTKILEDISKGVQNMTNYCVILRIVGGVSLIYNGQVEKNIYV